LEEMLITTPVVILFGVPAMVTLIVTVMLMKMTGQYFSQTLEEINIIIPALLV